MFYVIIVLIFMNSVIFSEEHHNSSSKGAFAKKIRRRSMTSLMFSNSTAFTSINRTSSCRWLKGLKHQNQLCRKRAGLPEVLLTARHLAVENCQEQFQYDRWNCSYKKAMFKKVYRETAFMYAVSSSAIAYAFAKACAAGKMRNCKCGEVESAQNNRYNWKWGGCADNTKQAKKFTRKFLELKNKGDGPNQVLNYNSKIGLKTVAQSEMKVCSCHGVSASCVMKTCFKRLQPFKTIAEKLKDRYHHAIQLSTGNKIKQSIKQFSKKSANLLYLDRSPNFCHSTAGRQCKDADNCATLCCDRKYNIEQTSIYKPCRCRWQHCCFDVECDKCSEKLFIFRCK